MQSDSVSVVTARKRGRPPRPEPAYGTSRAALIRVGVALLSEKGYSATGLEEVLRTAGVPKGSFYHYFASKDVFGAELIEAYAAYFARKLDRWLLDESTTPIERIRNFVADAKAGMARYEFRRGCVVGNLGQEMSALPELFRDRLHGVLLDWQARTERCLRDAQAAGQIAADADCAALAAFFWIGWEGAVLRAKLERSPEPLDLFATLFLTCLTR
ncbi:MULTISPECIES: TetR/AcrR family transcriptional regulator [Methylobacterium]|uniref:acrylate utilization transcriptional regulator AcuR n=1 Tax=Methylobacterium TaxID=407 RepID=UPI00047AA735|nr:MULTISPECIES: TetR/AcrR family transcriptional regulator [Methylobacterium]KQS69739.1 TetR family transcriptional regulator [Methylobacterium sp. Leaf361]MBN4094975.1 TetR/AcrR family transcriptional regulator [Methylobacterium sp. OT2]UIN32645.1 TetR/AcrR family transcriptional regulator [Methylobacterium oryzae]SEG45017.1 transcriptional regulator, TetR family [Methylobacterium sp. 190mf]SFD68465.1 transcriptional regulator, TetR family [Methylobacterium sp. 13MFTsu3.1M2]